MPWSDFCLREIKPRVWGHKTQNMTEWLALQKMIYDFDTRALFLFRYAWVLVAAVICQQFVVVQCALFTKAWSTTIRNSGKTHFSKTCGHYFTTSGHHTVPQTQKNQLRHTEFSSFNIFTTLINYEHTFGLCCDMLKSYLILLYSRLLDHR